MTDGCLWLALRSLGFSQVDLLLLAFSPICAGIGSTVNGMLTEMNPSRLPRAGRIRSHLEALAFLKWCSYRLFIGCALGLVVGLYFVGSLNDSPTSLARVLALAVILGYGAPKLWQLQEQQVLREAEATLSVGQSLKDQPPL